MIAKMSKVFVAASADKSDDFLKALRKLGVVHIVPVDADKAVPDNETLSKLNSLKTAIDTLEFVVPAGQKPQLDSMQAAEKVCDIIRREQELHNRLAAVRRNLLQIEAWGDVSVESIRRLEESGLKLMLASITAAELEELKKTAQCVTVLQENKKNTLTVAAVYKNSDDVTLPPSAVEIERPKIDAPTLRRQADEIKSQMEQDTEALSAAALMLDEIRREYARVDAKARFIVARNSALAGEKLFAVQGWIPSDIADSLASKLDTLGVVAAVGVMPPEEGENPPTLIRYHRWVKPIIALFDILGTVPGYKEYDMAPFFMLAMPVFTAMLVGDAGYGLIFTLVGLIFGRKLHRLTGNKSAGQLITIFGIFTIIWGVITANYFGVGPSDIAKAGGYGCIVKGEFQPDYHAMEIADGGWADFGKIMLAPAVLWRPNDSDARDIVMKISFIIAVLHLMLAHMRKMVGLFPSQQFIAEAGWMIFIFGMFELVWLMFFGAPPVGSTTLMIYFLAVGMLLFSLFSFPSPNPVKRVGFGIMTNLLPIISSFGDTLSYIRLMAVGLASYYMASAFNGLAMKIFHADWYLAWTGVLILLAAHALNIFLCVIAIFAHGVRLNLLEFSNNCGVEWAGYPYTPFYDTLEKQGE